MTTLDTLQPYLVALGLVLVRCTSMLLVVPTVGGEVVPVRLRGAIAVVMSVTLASLATSPRLTVHDPLALIVAGLGELLMGLAMGAVVRLLLASAEMAGQLADMAMGLSFMQLVDPLTRESGTGSSQLLNAVAMLVLLAVDGHQVMLAGMAASLQQAPVGTVLPRAAYITTLLPLLATACSAALRFAAPVIVALLLTNGALGLLARAAPQLNLFVLSFGVTIAVGMMMLVSSVGPSMTLYASELRRMAEYLAVVFGG